MNTLLLIIGLIFIIGGLIGCIFPILPGPPISYAGMLIIHLAEKWQFSDQLLIILGTLTVLVTILENVIPIWGTKRFGGSKAGIWGATIGLIAGFIFLNVLGIIIGPFIGAVTGELLSRKDTKSALKAGGGAFLGFLAGTGIKLANTGLIIFFVFKEIL